MDRMKTFFKYFIIVLAFYILSNIAIGFIMKPSKAQASSEYAQSASINSEFDWEELSHDPFFWFITLGGLIVTLT